MAIVPKSFEVRRGRYSEVLAARDKSVIEDLYRFQTASVMFVTPPKLTTTNKNVKGDIAVSFTIDEGHQYTVASLTVIGV